MAITGCTAATEHKIFSGNTTVVHPQINSVEYSEALSGYTIVPSIQCRSVRLGGQGVNS